MAVLFFGVTGPTLDLTEELNIADGDAPRILEYLMQSPFGKVTENVQSTVPDPNWVPDPGQTEADRPMIEDPDWVPAEDQTEADRPMIPDDTWVPRPAQTQADNPGIPVQQWVTRQATPDETAANYAKHILANLLSETVAYEKAKAAQLAAEAVTPIEIVG